MVLLKASVKPLAAR